MSDKAVLQAQIAQLIAGTLETLVDPKPKQPLESSVPTVIKGIDKLFLESPARSCMHAGLWLLADDLAKAHGICQDISTAHGSAWHAVVHRIEGDFWNSKYWWRRAGDLRWVDLPQQIRAALAAPPAEVKQLSSAGTYRPELFVDLVEASSRFASVDLRQALITIQKLEWSSLFDASWRAAEGK